MLAAVAAACLLLAASSAQAFTRAPIELGPADGARPSAVVDAAGTAFVTWGIAEDLIGTCVLPRGARACAATATLSLDARASRPILLRRPQDGALFIVVGRDDLASDPDESVWAFSSADGVTWAGPVPIGLGLGGKLDAAVLTPDGLSADLLQADTGVSLYQRAPLAGPPATGLLNLANRPDGSVGAWDQPGDLLTTRRGRTLALLGSPADGFAFRVLTGPDPFADGSWTPFPARPVTRTAEDPRGAGGRRGTFVMYARNPLEQIRGAAPQVVRRLRGRRWARPRGVLYEIESNTDRSALAQDARGQLHAAAVGYDNRGRRECIAYARTRTGRWFSRAVSLTQANRDADRPCRPDLAVGPAGRGVVAWSTTGPPSVARVQRLAAGRGVTKPRPRSRRGCPRFPR